MSAVAKLTVYGDLMKGQETMVRIKTVEFRASIRAFPRNKKTFCINEGDLTVSNFN